ncbi:MAG: hypothetical protein SFW66_10780 [Gammaproteobacteria bacterium]|nr:hypothetical protein [Gammaproteobacteria bacterium]
MGMTRVILSLLPVVGAAYVVPEAAKWKISSGTQTGVINNVGKRGAFFETNEMTLNPGEFSNGNRLNSMEMSLHDNKKLFKKANEFCNKGSFVKVEYDRFFGVDPRKGLSSRVVTNIEEIRTPTYKK